MHWMILPFKRYFEFQGRSRRLEFWMFSLLNVIVFTVLAAITLGTGATMDRMANADPENPLAIYQILFSGVGLLMVVWWLSP